ncbi:hypothetical protein B0A49_01105 [Cryomyces minteri]|uniref:Uncharacterized protein n=1 Tax=Cryomyces minteri TaxID=331657 RepID=A0A4U0XWG9_9PEZI|nr:hypothetical protein B0A49_01105 [Cryomyces minteri]
MTSSNDDKDPTSPSSHNNHDRNDHEDNPFIAFRRYADAQISSMFEHLAGFGAAANARFLEEQRKWEAYRREEGPGGRTYAGNERPRDSRLENQGNELASKDSTAQRSTANSTLDDPYEPAIRQLEALHSGSAHTPPNQEHTEEGRLRPSRNPSLTARAWPTLCLWEDPYSPLQLEQHPRLSQAGAHWRRAYQDLMLLRQGREMLEYTDEQQREERSAESGREWIERLFDSRALSSQTVADLTRGSVWAEGGFGRGYSPWWSRDSQLARDLVMFGADHGGRSSATAAANDRSSSLAQGASLADAILGMVAPSAAGRKQQDEPATELDLYERFLGTQEQHHSHNHAYSSSSSSMSAASSTLLQPDAADEEATANATTNGKGDPRVSIVSTLTSTGRRIAPDGTVTTKVALKRRFGDGREESSETVHTTQGQLRNGTESEEADRAEMGGRPGEREGESGSREGRGQREEKGARTWFWSG